MRDISLREWTTFRLDFCILWTSFRLTNTLLQYATKASLMKDFDGDIFKRFVERVVVYSRTEIGFELKCGITLKERLVSK